MKNLILLLFVITLFTSCNKRSPEQVHTESVKSPDTLKHSQDSIEEKEFEEM